MFCEAGVNLDTKSCLDPEKEERMAILDDDFCPNCEEEGYILEKHGKGYIDCEKCLQLMCEFCYKQDGECKKCWGKPLVREVIFVVIILLKIKGMITVMLEWGRVGSWFESGFEA